MPSLLEGSHRELQCKKAYRTDTCKAKVFLHGWPQELCQEAPVEDSLEEHPTWEEGASIQVEVVELFEEISEEPWSCLRRYRRSRTRQFPRRGG